MKPCYLIRFDDICPTMNWNIWGEIENILENAGVKPILAVIPDNKDKKLMVSAPSVDFWNKVRKWQAKGYTIGLHGYEHRYVTKDSGILKLNKYSEFALLSYLEQKKKISNAIEIFCREEIVPQIWIAPAHSFDSVTVKLLKAFGINYISDGFSLWPYYDNGVMWIPQQLWKFRKLPFGVWTICFHHNRWTSLDINNFSKNIEVFNSYISSFDIVCNTFQRRIPEITDVLSAYLIHKAIILKKNYMNLL